MTTPVYVTEEKKELFYVMHYMKDAAEIYVDNNIIVMLSPEPSVTPFENTLEPVFNAPIGTERAKWLTYNIFSNNNFVLPLYLTRLAGKALWIGDFGDQKQETKAEVYAAHAGHVAVAFGKEKNKIPPQISRRTGCFMCHAGMGVDCSQFLSKPYILDFDMAFLGIGRFTRQPNETLIEITAAAYEEYYRNPYHYLHLGHNYIVPCQKDGKYYLSFSEDESIMDLPAEELSQRIDAVGAWIQAQKVPPLAIVINRSRYSNWLPQKYFPALEEEILQKLGAVMPVQIKYRPAI